MEVLALIGVLFLLLVGLIWSLVHQAKKSGIIETRARTAEEEVESAKEVDQVMSQPIPRGRDLLERLRNRRLRRRAALSRLERGSGSGSGEDSDDG